MYFGVFLTVAGGLTTVFGAVGSVVVRSISLFRSFASGLETLRIYGMYAGDAIKILGSGVISFVRQGITAAAHNLTKVYFKQIGSSKKTESSYGTATLEFWEYVPMQVATKQAGGTGSGSGSSSAGSASQSSSADGITAGYQEYLNTQRGKAPQIKDKTAASPAKDN